MPEVVELIAPSRLHFGMFSFAQPGVRQFGGVGAMIDRPGLRLRVTPGDRLRVSGPAHERAAEFTRRIADRWQTGGELPCRIEVVTAPRQHTGLGTGTQLALAVAAALHTFFERPYHGAVELAHAVGRGLRSAIGTHGFEHGGLLVEAGKLPSDVVSPLVSRVPLPASWRFVLVTPKRQSGLSGQRERDAFERLPPVPPEATAALCQETLLHLLPAAVAGDFDEFSQSLYRYGYRAGLCFAAAQQGAFATRQAHDLANAIRARGIAGVGQSSWGPTLFALVADEPQAEQLVGWLAAQAGGDELDLAIAAPDNRGATITVDGIDQSRPAK